MSEGGEADHFCRSFAPIFLALRAISNTAMGNQQSGTFGQKLETVAKTTLITASRLVSPFATVVSPFLVPYMYAKRNFTGFATDMIAGALTAPVFPIVLPIVALAEIKFNVELKFKNAELKFNGHRVWFLLLYIKK